MSAAEAFVLEWVARYNAGSWVALEELEHAGGVPNLSYLKGLYDAGYRIERWTLMPFRSYPKWSIFHEYRLFPRPEYWCDLQLANPEGRSQEIYMTFAASHAVYKTCYYIDAPVKPVRKLDLRVECQRVIKWLISANKSIAKLKVEPVQLLTLEFSTEQGYVNVHLNTASSEPGLLPTHEQIKQLSCWNWASFRETGDSLIDLEGHVLERHVTDPSCWVGIHRSQKLDDLIGHLLIQAVKAWRDAENLPIERFAPFAQFDIEEIEGRFGFPAYEQRGLKNLVFPSFPDGAGAS